MRVEIVYVPVEVEPEQWRRRIARLLGRGITAQLAAVGQGRVPSRDERSQQELLSEEAEQDSDKGQVVDGSCDLREEQ